MKKCTFIYFALLFACASAPAVAEVIDSVSFNPSRLGMFQQLRATEVLQSAGSIDVSPDLYSQGNVTLIGSSFTVYHVDGRAGQIDMQHTKLHVSGNLQVNGGYMLFMGDPTLGVFSEVSALPATSWILTNNFTASTLQVNGNTGDAARTFDKEYVEGLELGGNDIPIPTLRGCNGNLSWVDRKASDNKTYKVLAVGGCPGGNPGGGQGSCAAGFTDYAGKCYKVIKEEAAYIVRPPYGGAVVNGGPDIDWGDYTGGLPECSGDLTKEQCAAGVTQCVSPVKHRQLHYGNSYWVEFSSSSSADIAYWTNGFCGCGETNATAAKCNLAVPKTYACFDASGNQVSCGQFCYTLCPSKNGSPCVNTAPTLPEGYSRYRASGARIIYDKYTCQIADMQ